MVLSIHLFTTIFFCIRRIYNKRHHMQFFHKDKGTKNNEVHYRSIDNTVLTPSTLGCIVIFIVLLYVDFIQIHILFRDKKNSTDFDH